ncbi:MAG: hypothetical protein QGF46_08025, partial [Planctomycetota bacterium]|nr:hypothetical protein [Planctomycetota bacterium]
MPSRDGGRHHCMLIDEKITSTLCLPQLNSRQLFLCSGLTPAEISIRMGLNIEVASRLAASLQLGKLAIESQIELLPAIKNGTEVADFVRA